MRKRAAIRTRPAKFRWLTGLSLAASLVASARGGELNIATGTGDMAIQVTSQQRARAAAVFRQQYDFSCGSAAIATLLSYHYGAPITEQAAFDAMYEQGDTELIRREGFSMLDMKRLLKRRGFEADGFELPLDKLAEAHIPAIVLLSEQGYNHFVVVKGLRAGRVLIGDPSKGIRSVSRAAFERSWHNRLLFVIHSHQDIATFDSNVDWHAAPPAPLHAGIERESMNSMTWALAGALPR